MDCLDVDSGELVYVCVCVFVVVALKDIYTYTKTYIMRKTTIQQQTHGSYTEATHANRHESIRIEHIDHLLVCFSSCLQSELISMHVCVFNVLV